MSRQLAGHRHTFDHGAGLRPEQPDGEHPRVVGDAVAAGPPFVAVVRLVHPALDEAPGVRVAHQLQGGQATAALELLTMPRQLRRGGVLVLPTLFASALDILTPDTGGGVALGDFLRREMSSHDADAVRKSHCLLP